MIYAFLLLGPAAFIISYFILRHLKDKMPLKGKDYHKNDHPFLPEAMGLCSSISFIINLFLFLISQERNMDFYKYLAIASSSTFTVLLGFIDDVMGFEWRYKLIFPAISIIPTLLLYSEGTCVIIPLFGLQDIGILYYIYMMCCATFSTNAINILSGINGLEVSQVLILSFFIMIDNILRADILGIFIPFILICSSFPLYWYNKCPARVFVGDNYCYFAGMVLSCVAILTHTTRTLFLLMGIQVINFAISLPQLFGMIKCPRHRMPDFDGVNVICSVVKHNEYQIHNLTILNVILNIIGPMKEIDLCDLMISLQMLWCGIVIILKYMFFYNIK